MLSLPLLLLSLAASPSGGGSITVLAASSLRQPLEQADAEFEKIHPGVKVQLSTAATGVIAAQLEQGAPADVFIGAAREPSEELATKGVLGAPTLIARNHLVVGVPSGSTLHPTALADLTQASFHRIGIGNRKTVPAGQYAHQVLAATHLEAALRDRFVNGESVAQVLALLKGGDLQAGFVYASDVAGSGGAVEVAFVIDDALHDPIVYPASVVKRSLNAELAAAYVAFLQSAAGQADLTRAGFLHPVEAGIDVAGAIARPGRITVAELKAMDAVSGTWNEHGTPHSVRGVPLDRVLTRFGFDPGPMGKSVPKAEKRSGWKKVVVASAPDGFQAVFSCAEIFETMGATRALLIWELDGQPLSPAQGPVRLVVLTDQEPSRSLYGLTHLEVVDMRQIAPPPVTQP